MEKSDNFILDFTFNFSLKIIAYAQLLSDQRKYVMSDQLFRCGTSIGSQVSEAQSPESKKDFIHKFKIAVKEAEETLYRLRLCKYSNGFPECDDLLNDIVIIKKVIGKIISSSKK